MRPSDDVLLKVSDDKLTNYAEDHILNSDKAIVKQKQHRNVCCYCFHDDKIFTGYEDGLICCWDMGEGELYAPLIGHTNRINYISATDGEKIFSASNDCTVRAWNTKTGVCDSVFKFSDPISSVEISLSNNMMYSVSWDKMVRVVDLDANKVTKSFVAAKEAIKALHVTNDYVFVAGCDPIIRGFNLQTGETIQYIGHQGWVYCLTTYNNYLLSGGDDKTIKVWDIKTGKCVEELGGHENGVTCLAFANNELFSGSFDHYIICWDVVELEKRIYERDLMRKEDILSRKIEVYWRTIEARKGKKKKKGGKKGGKKGKKK